MQDWFKINICGKRQNHGKEEWGRLWAMTCHAAWMQRNKEKHEERFLRPARQDVAIRRMLEHVSVDEEVIQVNNRKQQVSIQVGWQSPKEGWVCLNMDGGCRNGVIGCGGVIKGSEGEWLTVFSKLVIRWDAQEAELWGYQKVLVWLLLHE